MGRKRKERGGNFGKVKEGKGRGWEDKGMTRESMGKYQYNDVITPKAVVWGEGGVELITYSNPAF